MYSPSSVIIRRDQSERKHELKEWGVYLWMKNTNAYVSADQEEQEVPKEKHSNGHF